MRSNCEIRRRGKEDEEMRSNEEIRRSGMTWEITEKGNNGGMTTNRGHMN